MHAFISPIYVYLRKTTIFITPCYICDIKFPFCRIGPLNCSVSVTASRLTGDSLVVRWVIGHCFPAEPTKYWIQWFPIGKPIPIDELKYNGATINSNISSYKITGLSSNIKYFIWFGFYGMCSGTGPLQSVVSETMSGEFPLF